MFLVAFAFAFVFLGGTVQSDDEIGWSADRKLTWSDFPTIAKINTPYKAMTHSGIRFDGAYEGDQLTLSVACYFIKSKSWQLEGHASEKLLRHEQGHFDITEIFARKLRQRYQSLDLQRLSSEGQAGFSKIEAIYQATYDAMEKEQERYDKETDHSKNAEKQLQWDRYIAKELKQLESFASM